MMMDQSLARKLALKLARFVTYQVDRLKPRMVMVQPPPIRRQLRLLRLLREQPHRLHWHEYRSRVSCQRPQSNTSLVSGPTHSGTQTTHTCTAKKVKTLLTSFTGCCPRTHHRKIVGVAARKRTSSSVWLTKMLMCSMVRYRVVLRWVMPMRSGCSNLVKPWICQSRPGRLNQSGQPVSQI